MNKKEKAFFALYARAIREGTEFWFLPLGPIPSQAVICETRKSPDGDREARITAATPGATKGIKKIPTPWMAQGELPDIIRSALLNYRDLIWGLGGFRPTPWNLGVASQLLKKGCVPTDYLAMGAVRFSKDQRPLGVLLLPAEHDVVKGLMVSRIYNPAGAPGVPETESFLSQPELKSGQSLLHGLIKFWASIEEQYFINYDEKGRPRQKL